MIICNVSGHNVNDHNRNISDHNHNIKIIWSVIVMLMIKVISAIIIVMIIKQPHQSSAPTQLMQISSSSSCLNKANDQHIHHFNQSIWSCLYMYMIVVTLKWRISDWKSHHLILNGCHVSKIIPRHHQSPQRTLDHRDRLIIGGPSKILCYYQKDNQHHH